MAKYAVSTLPRVDAEVALGVLQGALLGARDGLERSARVTVDPKGSAMIEVQTKNTSLGVQTPDKEIEGRFYDSFNAHPKNRAAGLSAPTDNRPQILAEKFENTNLFGEVAMLLARALSDSNGPFSARRSADELARPIEGQLYLIGKDGALAEAAASLTSVEWRSTGMTIGAVQPESSGGEIAIAQIGINTALGATQDLALKHPKAYGDELTALRGYKWGAGILLLTPEFELPLSIRSDAEDLISLLATKGGRPTHGFALALYWPGQGTNGAAGAMTSHAPLRVAAFPLPDTPIIPTATTIGGPRAVESRALDIQFVDLKKTDNATAELRELMRRNAEDIGYRLELRRLPHYAEIGDELEEVQRKIEELELRRAFLNGESVGDHRLLRFPADGLPALIDYLRRFPIDVVDRERIRYAFHSSTADPKGVHYLLYRLRDVGLEPAYPEAYWERDSGSGTIVHRIDPLFGQFAASGGARSLVFTPRHHVTVPNFRATQQAVDTYLRQGFGGLLGVDDAFSQASAGSGEEPIYVLGSTRKGEVRLEIMDGAQFAPVGRVVPFLNDNLELSRRIDIADFVSNAADAHWRKERLDELEAASADLGERLSTRMEGIDRMLADQSADLLDALTTEVDAIRARVGSLLATVEELSERSTFVEGIAADAIRQAADADRSIEELPERFTELNGIRKKVEGAIVHQRELTRAFAGVAVDQLKGMKSDIDRLQRVLDGDE
jgi:hypothetical protein